MALKNIIITGSIGTYPSLSYGQKEYISSTDEQSFPIEQITGSNGGSMPNLMGMTSSVDLYVNISQSWDVIIDTPVGLVSSIHNTQDEFINGEFSGSTKIVTTQRLIDTEYEQFLQTNTTEVNYDPYFYSSNITPLGEFLDTNTTPNIGEIYLLFNSSSLGSGPITKGIKYIKINRFDKQGNNNTISLQELTNIRLNFSDLGIVNIPILTISEYGDHYLYGVNITLGESTSKFKSPTDPTSSPNTYLLPSGNNVSPIFYGYTDTTGSINGNGLFNFLNGGYTITTTCIFSASCSPPPNSKPRISIIFTGSNGIINKKQINITQNGTYSSSISYVPTSGSTLGIVFASSSLNTSINLPSIDFRITQDITSSIDNNVLDHSIEANKIGVTSITGNTSATIDNYDNISVNLLGYFDSSSGLITFGDTPNVKISITASVTVPTSSIYFSLFGSSEESEDTITTVNTSNPTGGTLTLSASFTPVENSTYWLNIQNNGSNVSSYNNVELFVTQSIDPYSLPVLTILEPYLTSNFFYNDCNVLYGNADGLEYNNNFMSVNYDGDGGSVIPSNQQQILDNTAERAPVKPYNYTLQSQILPRYNGVRVTQQNPTLNRNPINNQMFFTGDYSWTEGDIAPDKTPSVNQTTTYFAYFNGLKSNNPIFKNTTSPIIKYVIREDGTTSNPATDDITYYNLLYSFPRSSKSKANLLYDKTTIFNSPQTILLSGESYTPIIYNLSSYVGNNATFVSDLEFTNIFGGYSSNPTNFDFYKYSRNWLNSGQGQILLESNGDIWKTDSTNYASSSIPNLNGRREINPFYLGTGSSQYWYNATSIDGYGDTTNWTQDIDTDPNPDPVTGSYFQFRSIPQSSVNIECTVYIVESLGYQQGQYPPYFYGNRPTSNLSNPTKVRLRLYLKQGTNTPVQLTYKDFSIPYWNPQQQQVIMNYPSFNAQYNDIIFFTVENIGTMNFLINAFKIGTGYGASTFRVTTNSDGGTINGPIFWITGSANDTTITSSLELGSVLQGNFKQLDITSSGFEPIETPANINIGDEFRFEYDESNVFTVVSSSIQNSASGQACFVSFDRAIPQYLNINHFTVRRKIKDFITGISLNNNLAIPISGGFLLPENPSDAMKRNLPKITSDLSEKNKI